MTSSNQHPCFKKKAVEKMQEDGFPSWHSSMSKVCTLCSGPIEAPDTHEFCILCLGLAHVEAALNGSDCLNFSKKMLRAWRNISLASIPLPPASCRWDDSRTWVITQEGTIHPPTLQCVLLKRVSDPPQVLRRLFLSAWRGRMISMRQCP